MKQAPRILVVDDTPANIKVVGEALNEYDVIVATNGEQALAFAQKEPLPELILLDIMMPDLDGYEVCRRLKQHAKTRSIPVIFLTALTDAENEAKGFALGAVDYIVKPINPVLVQARVSTHLALKRYQTELESLVAERTEALQKTRLEILLRLAQAAEYRDNETGNHIMRMSEYCATLGRLVGLEPKVCETLHYASSLHDVGKIGIADAILLKPGKLTPDEMEIMKQHTTIGYRMLDGMNFELMEMAKMIAYTHHEKWDGTGYPRGLQGEAIPIEGRITTVCDVFDALLSTRPYKTAWSVPDTLGFLQQQSGRHFDPQLVELFLKHGDQFVKIRQSYAE